MSSMLEQAIVDAEALKEAAIKNAESIIIDKYSEEVKKAVHNLLEQDEEMDLDMDMEEEPLDAAPPEEGEASDIADDVPPAHSVGSSGDDEVDALRDAVDTAEEALEGVSDKLDALENVADAGEDSEVEIDLDQLRAQLDDEGEVEADDMVDREDVAADLEEEPPLEEAAEEFDIDPATLEALVQELRVDLDPKAGGWLSYPDEKLHHAAEQKLAAAQDDAVAEENDELRKAMKSVQLENKNLQKQSNTRQEKNKKLEQTIMHLKGRFDEINLSNARLLYTNKVLNSTSLNERQKNKIVDAISKADTIEEAKVIYETLENATGEAKTEAMPKSLSEVVHRSSSMLVSRNRKREETISESFSDRMQKLAGIK